MEKIEPLQLERPYKICVELETEYFFLVVADRIDEDEGGKVLEFMIGAELVARCIKEDVTDLSTHEI